MSYYTIASEAFGLTRTTAPRPTLGLAIKEYFDLIANDRPNLDWVDGSYPDSSARKWMFFSCSSDMRDGVFYLKVITVGSQSWLLCNDPEENAAVMANVGAAIAAAQPDERFNAVEYDLQLMRVEAVDLTEGGL